MGATMNWRQIEELRQEVRIRGFVGSYFGETLTVTVHLDLTAEERKRGCMFAHTGVSSLDPREAFSSALLAAKQHKQRMMSTRLDVVG